MYEKCGFVSVLNVTLYDKLLKNGPRLPGHTVGVKQLTKRETNK